MAGDRADRIFKMNPEHPVVPESAHNTKTYRQTKKLGDLKGNRSQPKRTMNGQIQNNLDNKRNKVVVGYNQSIKYISMNPQLNN